MKNKYYNDALTGNENIVVSFNSKGELLRLYYPTRDYRQFVDELICGIRINKSMLIKLNSDTSNKYEQYYSLRLYGLRKNHRGKKPRAEKRQTLC